jgi:Family of unknown function (DUF6169)
MTIQEPYKFNKSGDSYKFYTDNDVYYSIDFTDGSYYFVKFPNYLSIYEYSLNVLSTGKHLSPPPDKRIELTVVAILSAFLSFRENCVIYVCQNMDKRHYARKRKFDFWFTQNQGNNLEKHDVAVEYEDTIYLSSLIIPKNNTNKDEIIALFIDQGNQFNK